MNFFEFQKFLAEGEYDIILGQLSEVFSEIDYIAGELNSGEVSLDQYKDYLSRLTGIYMYLSPLVAEAVSMKKNRELREYHEIKIQQENEGKKFVSAPAEKEASMKVADLRRIRNILQAYLDACRVGIVTCQSILKHKLDEINFTKD